MPTRTASCRVGLERPDFYNWFERDQPGRAGGSVRDVVVVALGANDDHSYMTGLPANVSVGEFARRSLGQRDEPTARRRLHGHGHSRRRLPRLTSGLPITSSESQSQRYEIINRIAFQEAKTP